MYKNKVKYGNKTTKLKGGRIKDLDRKRIKEKRKRRELTMMNTRGHFPLLRMRIVKIKWRTIR